MGSFENLDTEEPLAPRMERHAFDRLIMLSDGVFAIAITLAALEMHPPHQWTGVADLWSAIRFSVAAYLVSFMVVAAYWTSHRELMSRLRKVDSVFTVLCLGQLFFVALVPSATQLLYQSSGLNPAAVQVYAATLAGCGFISSAMWTYGTYRRGLMVQVEPDWRIRWARLLSALIVPVFFMVILVSGGQHLMWVIYATVVFVIVRRVALPMWTRRTRAELKA